MNGMGKTKNRKEREFGALSSAGLLSGLSDENLAAAVELNFAEWLRIQGRLPWVQFHDHGDALQLFAGDAWPRNYVALARFTSETAQRRVGELFAPHLRSKVACNWVVGPVSQPADLGKHLRAHGFRCMMHCAGMACDLNELPPSPSSPDRVLVELVDRPPSLYPLTTERRRLRHQGHGTMALVKPRQFWHFAASCEGKPVGETTLFFGAGVGGIYGVEVLEGFRRRGIGTALVHAALQHARQLGHDAAVLAATGMGLGVYSRLGFREVCKLSFWKYGKMRQL
jgi:GNAT superfamily N-acetyltransferase